MKTVVVVIYFLLASVFILYLSFPHSSLQKISDRRHPGARRLAHLQHHRHVTFFDPLVEKLERRAEEQGILSLESFKNKLDAILEDREWNKAPDGIAILEEYFGEEGRLNITERLVYLFPFLDRYPKDEKVSFSELELWNQRQALDRLLYDAEWHLKLHDKNGDDELTLREFLKYQPEDQDHIEPGWWVEKFSNADIDENGSLNRTEMNDFLHPEDSKNQKVLWWWQNEKLREIDQNKDSKLSFSEFSNQMHRIYRKHMIIHEGDQKKPDVKKEFSNLDVNKDEYLTAEELKPIINLLHPGELYHATQYTKYLFQQADGDGDGMLTLQEMLNHRNAFYNTVYEEKHGQNFDDYSYNDELR